VNTLRHNVPPANSSVDVLAAAAAGLAAGLSLGNVWSQLRWLLDLLCGC
jgi:hypothetical protein